MGRRKPEKVKNITWRLAAMKPTVSAIETARSMKYFRICADYILVYGRTIPGGAVEIKGKDLDALTQADCAWLEECNHEIMRRFVNDHMETVKRGQAAFLQEFQRELERERLNCKGEETWKT